MNLGTQAPRRAERLGRAAPAHPRVPGRTPRGLLRQLTDVLSDAPLFFVTPLLRPWHRSWGATRDEVVAAMPGDDLLPDAQYRCTRSITIGAPPEEIWPWLVQVGVGRAGWYADDLLDNLARPSATQIRPELQDIHVGQWLPWLPHPSQRTSFIVDSYTAPHWLLWRAPNRTWAWRLLPSPGSGTRLITRMHVRYQWHRPSALLTVLLAEVADFPMMRRMLRGIRDRAETEHRRQAPSSRGAAHPSSRRGRDPGDDPSAAPVARGSRARDGSGPDEEAR